MRAERAGRARDEGVSTVLGAVLMFGLLVLTLVMVQVRFVPVWDEDAEAGHMRVVRGQFATLASDLGRQADRLAGVALANPLTLDRPGGFRFFSGERLPGTLSFNGDVADLTVSSPRLRLLESGGTALFSLSPAWTPVTGGAPDDIGGVSRVHSLRMRIDMHRPVCGEYEAQDSAVLTLFDATGKIVGRTVVTWLPASSSELAIKLDVFGNLDDGAVADDQVGSSTELFNNQVCQGSQDNFLDYHYFDLLDPSLEFGRVLAATSVPLALQLREFGLVADYQIAYDAVSPSGITTTVGGGLLDPTWSDPLNHRYAAGSLRFDAGNQRFVDQSYVLENGAVLLRQQDGAAVLVPPLLRVTGCTGTVNVEWTLPSLNAATQALGGARSATVLTTPAEERVDLRAVAVKLVLAVPTAHPAAWESFLDRTFTDAGCADGVEFTTDAGAGSVTLTVTGPVASDLGADDVGFVFKQADILVELRSGG